jgi:hypothetical protein
LKEKASKSTETSDDKSKNLGKHSVDASKRTVLGVFEEVVAKAVSFIFRDKKKLKGRAVRPGVPGQTVPAVAAKVFSVSSEEGPQQTPAPEQPKAG